MSAPRDEFYVELSPGGRLTDDQAERWERPIIVVLVAMVLLIPLLVVPQLSSIYELPKAVTLWIFGAVLLFLVVGKYLSRRNALSGGYGSSDRYLEWSVVGGLLVLATLSTALSIEPTTSFFGRYGRYDGLLTLAVGAVTYLAAMQVDWTSLRLQILSWSLASSALIAAVYGLAQTLGFEFISQQITFTAGRSAGTFGNPSLFVGFLVFSLPVAASLAVSHWRRQRSLSVFAIAMTAVIASALLMTLARGGWFGAAVGITIWAWMGRRHLAERRSLAVTLVAVIVGTGIAWTAITAVWDQPQLNVAARAAETASLADGSVGIRIETWKAAISAVADRPILGWGPDTYGLVSPGYETQRFIDLAGPVIEDNSHSILVQTALSSGIPAALLLLFMVILLVRRGISGTIGRTAREAGQSREVREILGEMLETGEGVLGEAEESGGLRVNVDESVNTHRSDTEIESREIAIAAFTAAGAGYFITVLTTVNPVGSGFLLWLSFGMIGALVADKVATRFRLPLVVRLPSAIRQGLLILIGLIPLVILVVGVLFLAADRNYEQGSQLEGLTFLQQARAKYDDAAGLNPWEQRYQRSSGRTVVITGLQIGDRTRMLEAADVFTDLRARSPLDINNHMFLGQAYLAMARTFTNTADARLAADAFQGAINVRPRSFEAYSFLAAALFHQGDYEASREAAEATLAIKDDGQAHYYLGRLYLQDGNSEAAGREFRRAVKLDPTLSEARQAVDDLPE